MNQLERLRILKDKFKGKEEKLNHPVHRVWLKELEILEKHPEYSDKLGHFEKRDVYMCSSTNVIIFLKLDEVEQ